MPVITTAILSQFQVTALFSAVIGGIIGNRSDDILCSSTKYILNRLKNQIHAPVNHDIQKAVRKSILSSTLIFSRKCFENYNLKDKLTSKEPLLLKEIINYLEKEIRKLSNPNISFREDGIDVDYRALLESKETKSEERIPDIVKSLKESLYNEFLNNNLKLEDKLVKNINFGLNDNNNVIDWYQLTCAFFAEELKSDKRLSTIIENDFLKGINFKLIDHEISLQKLQQEIETNHEQYSYLLNSIQLNLIEIKNELNLFIDEYEETTRKILKEELAKKTEIKGLPNFSLNKLYQEKEESLNRIIKREIEIAIEIKEFESSINKINDDKTLKLLENSLQKLKKENFEISKAKNHQESQLREFIVAILGLAEMLNQKETPSKRFLEAKVFFEKGEFEEADAVLNEKDIYGDIERAENDLEKLAKELILKAKNLLIIKSDNWLDLASKYFDKAVSICRNFEILNEASNFYLKHSNPSKAENLYKVALQVADEKDSTNFIYKNLGLIRMQLGDMDAAKEYHKIGIDKLKKASTPDDLHILSLLKNDLGVANFYQKKYTECEKYYLESLNIKNELLKQDRELHLKEVAMLLMNLGLLYTNTGIDYLESSDEKQAADEFIKSDKYYRESETAMIELLEIDYDSNIENYGRFLNNYGKLYYSRDDFKTAEIKFLKAMEIREMLAEDNIYQHGLVLGDTYLSLTSLYNFGFSERKKSLKFAKKAIEYYDMFEELHFARYHKEKCLEIIDSLNEKIKNDD